MTPLREIFFTFARVGLFTFGGGYSMLPLLQAEVVEKKGWATEAEVLDYFAVGQTLPGIIAINTALFIGNQCRGRRGGIVAALGVACPSVVVIMLIAAFLQGFLDNPIVQRAFWGIRVVVCALILQAVIRLWKTAVRDVFGIGVYIGVLALALFTPLPTVVLVLLAVAAGLARAWALRKRGDGP